MPRRAFLLAAIFCSGCGISGGDLREPIQSLTTDYGSVVVESKLLRSGDFESVVRDPELTVEMLRLRWFMVASPYMEATNGMGEVTKWPLQHPPDTLDAVNEATYFGYIRGLETGSAVPFFCDIEDDLCGCPVTTKYVTVTAECGCQYRLFPNSTCTDPYVSRTVKGSSCTIGSDASSCLGAEADGYTRLVNACVSACTATYGNLNVCKVGPDGTSTRLVAGGITSSTASLCRLQRGTCSGGTIIVARDGM